MARYKEYEYTQGKFIPIHFDKQILPGTFEHTLHYLIKEFLDALHRGQKVLVVSRYLAALLRGSSFST